MEAKGLKKGGMGPYAITFLNLIDRKCLVKELCHLGPLTTVCEETSRTEILHNKPNKSS